MSWIQVFSNGFVCEMDGETAISSVDTKREVKKLIDALQDSKAGLYEIADHSKPLPTIEKPPATAASAAKPFLCLTKTNQKDGDGLVKLVLSLVKGSAVIDSLPTISGQSWAQNFRTAGVSHSGSMEPLPEGYWTVGVLEFASGVQGDYSESWGDGLGPVYVELNCTSPTRRADIGIHLDANAPEVPGTAGCVGIPKAGADGLANLKKFVSWFKNTAESPQTIVVDWGLGTVETK